VWISRVRHSDLLVLLARTTPLSRGPRKSDGMSVFLVDLRESVGKGLTLRSIPNMVNHETNELFFDNLEIPADNLIGEEGNMAKHLAAKASWEAANACLQTHGGFGFASEYDIERKFRETRLYQVAYTSSCPR
jgi:alkylation response protein AidB-like acyl-CoA dehydrogenase